MKGEALPKSRAAAIAEICELMTQWDISIDQLLEPLPPARVTLMRPPSPCPAALLDAPAPVRVAEPLPAARAVIVETPATRRTVAPPVRHDPRYQCDPSEPVEGCGFMSDWRSRRSPA